MPISLWVKRAKSYDLKTNSYGNGCFAFISTGGSKGGSSSYLLGAIACNRDACPMTLEQRQTISQSIRIENPMYRAPRNTCLLYTSPSPRDVEESRMPSSA